MSTPATRPRPRSRSRRRRNPLPLLVGGLLAVVAAVALALSVNGSDATTTPTDASDSTGELNAMGMPVIATPGQPAGTASAAGVEVAGANWQLGRVPLNVAVRPSWTLRNTGAEPVVIGEPRAEVRQGCCPGPFTIGTTRLAPGEQTELTFELSMHPGMDGPHDLGVHVPVTGPAGTDHLVLAVAGDFR